MRFRSNEFLDRDTRIRHWGRSVDVKTLSIEMEDEVRRALDRLVQRTAQSVDDIVNQAVRDYSEVQEWQQRKVEAGITAADRGEFATEDEIARIAAKYSKRG